MSRINTNIPSIQAQHRLAANQGDLGIRLERLSTGLRINRGRDDPAGLIASETLRSEIRGISQAVENSQRAINVISTAEGALNEISSLLLDIRGLINHAANQGAISHEELKADQLQIDSLLSAIDRIANTTQFAGAKLINGSLAYSVSGMAASAVAYATVFGARIPDNGAQTVTVQITNSAQTANVNMSAGTLNGPLTIAVAGRHGTVSLSFASGTTAEQIATAINGERISTGVSAFTSGGVVRINSTDYGSDAFVSVKAIDGSYDLAGGGTVTQGNESRDDGVDTGVLVNGQAASVQGLIASVRTASLDAVLELTADRATRLGESIFTLTGGGATFQIGPEVNVNGQVSIGIPSMNTTNLGNSVTGFLNTIGDGRANSVIGKNFEMAERIVVEAVSQVAVVRGRLGGLQRNQIETNINSQRVALENVQAAESAIRDADIAVEVAALTRSQILVQSTTSILGLANQLPQNVLALLG